MADRPPSKREEAKQLQKDRLKAFLEEPMRDGNISVDLPSNTITPEEKTKSMNEQIDKILKPFHQEPKIDA
ncbi:hypothetical protein CONLIGDRAFT_633567 [Coniochaeta ligniaria NRRL 30616]|uniref:Uncharacterized protein n=1 Tax=Coniochaeta ligniaria NRRL 30616 TaxID=1408157 RepID=A0A1J7J1N4_9PEZI|nr:hypothetical protein CONLIGDRAFT_633567 [Coniochaeta ligniaria NRRL 30616]